MRGVDAEQSGEGKARSFIPKNAWRTCTRLAEVAVYKMLCAAAKKPTSHLTKLDGVAQFVEGGDVFDPLQPNEVTRASNHREGFGKLVKKDDDPALQRLVLASHGRKLYEVATFSPPMFGAKKINSGTL